MSRIAHLWRKLSDAINAPLTGESILARRAIPPWDSTDHRVTAAWLALTSPENLDALVEWGKGNLNPRARACTDKAIEVCRSRSKTDGEQDGAANGSQPLGPQTNGTSSAAGSGG